ncbi:uncharacterized protein A1O9_12205 [Exophiala aquamarina CBS 119918]|uniref:SET domain-containing protein n=1 Tax=Exophiala aquamarina CBS 119918 TaxID=1182545 RepID=A0A072NWR3_9EURO|nr:uncharacterized protein A1O9_12205 [Exophiala aquamarina CBS 119918]KEF51867.1 hypothetical protein A1O9_12205 [Exophiala aquamarina CBS 119918]
MSPLINRLTANYSKKSHFSLYTHIIQPIKILEELGIDVFADNRYESWVLQTTIARMDVNVREFEAFEDYIIAINPLYSFLNHSCTPNTKVTLLDRTGSSLLQLVAKRDIEADEELTISY